MSTVARSKVLVVEDDSAIRDLLTLVLEEAGYEVVAVASGRQALRVFSSAPPDLVVMELLTPDGDARYFRCQQHQQASWAGVPLVILTSSKRSFELAAPLSFDAVLLKPFALDDLLQTVDGLIQGASPPDRRAS